jgi:hypothetical protein
MKLFFCPICQDVLKCQKLNRTCHCGASGGRYTDNLSAVYWGKAIPLGFANSSFARALRNQPKTGLGEPFEAFVIPKRCPTFKHVTIPAQGLNICDKEVYVMTEAEAEALQNTAKPNKPKIKPKFLPTRNNHALDSDSSL